MAMKTPTHDHGTACYAATRPAPRFRAIDAAEARLFEHQIEDLQLARLANTVLTKSPADIMALSEANPHLVWEWMQAFSAKKHEADAAGQLWSSAMACLATTGHGRRSPKHAAAK